MSSNSNTMDNVFDFIEGIKFKEWIQNYYHAEMYFYMCRSRLETLENMLDRVKFNQNIEGNRSKKILQQRFDTLEQIDELDEKEGQHNSVLKNFESLRDKATGIWEKLSTEQIKDRPSQKKLMRLKERYNAIDLEKEKAEKELKKIWNYQALIRMRKELIHWKAVRIQKASLKLSSRASKYNGRISKLKKLVEKERKNFIKALELFQNVKGELSKIFECEFVENFVCFPLGQVGVLYSLIDDSSLFPVPIQKNKVYQMNMEDGFASVHEVDVNERAA